MKRDKKLAALLLAILLIIGTVAGCAGPGIMDINNREYFDIPEDEIYIDVSEEMIPLASSSAAFKIPVPSASGKETKSTSKATIDYSNAADGYIMAKFATKTNKELRVLITGPSDVRYQYTLSKNAVYEVFPLSDGNGKYSIVIAEQVDGSKFAVAASASINVKLKDEFAPFLTPNQFVNFNKDSKTVAKAAELTKNAKNLTEQISAVYNFVIKNIKYDKKFAESVKLGQQSNYVPNVDSVLANGKGICFDYAALMAAMLRSQGVPTRLVVGFAGTLWHAWIDVYSKEEGWINSAIFFDGKEWKMMDPTFISTGGDSAVSRFVGEGNNYSARFLY